MTRIPRQLVACIIIAIHESFENNYHINKFSKSFDIGSGLTGISNFNNPGKFQ